MKETYTKHRGHIKVIEVTLVEWSESLQISMACSLGHADSISYDKTHCHRTKFWYKQESINHRFYGKLTFLLLFVWFFFVCLLYVMSD